MKPFKYVPLRSFYFSGLSIVYTMQAIPTIREKRIAPPIPSLTAEPTNNPAAAAITMRTRDTAVLNFLIKTSLNSITA